MSSFHSTTTTQGDVATMTFEGELDLSSAPQAEGDLTAIERDGATATIVLDLRGLRFLDSTGLRVILAADSRARRDGRTLKVIAGPEAVHRVFRIALLDRRLEFVDPAVDRTEEGSA